MTKRPWFLSDCPRWPQGVRCALLPLPAWRPHEHETADSPVRSAGADGRLQQDAAPERNHSAGCDTARGHRAAAVRDSSRGYHRAAAVGDSSLLGDPAPESAAAQPVTGTPGDPRGVLLRENAAPDIRTPVVPTDK